jgi:hypothetical protein
LRRFRLPGRIVTPQGKATDMAVTFALNSTTIASSDGGTQAELVSVNGGDLFVITFSDGTRIAIGNYNDPDGTSEFVVGTPVPSSATDTVNLELISIGNNTSFIVYDYDFGSVGAALYNFNSGSNPQACIQLRFNTITNLLQIDVSYSNTYGGDTGYNTNYNGTFASFSGSTVLTSTICYLAGTRILTDRGHVPVEDLRPGTLVATRYGGLRPVRWIGTQTLLALGARGMLAPVCIRPGALGENQPAHDLWVSPGHAVLLGDHLVCAFLLVNGTTIVQPAHTGEIRYFHIDLGDHDCVLAEGAWAETYYEHLNREAFDNAAEYQAQFPAAAPRIQPTCLPYVNQPGHPALPALRALVAARAPQPETPHLLADGAVILPDPASPHGTWRFTLPEPATTLRLRSPAATPAEAFGRPDTRRLGLRLRAATLEHAGTTTALDLAAPLTDGWHQPEPTISTLWRWTNGDAALPFQGPGTLTLHGYALLEAAQPTRAAA